jgi:zinc/manganese transport system permease protein
VKGVVLADARWGEVVNFSNYAELLPLVRNSLIAGVVLGLLGGLIGVFVMARDLPFAVHGISELSFAGASGALLLGANVVLGSIVGSLVAAVILGLLGQRARDRNSVIGVLMPFGLGLGILFLALYKGRSANKFGLLTGQIVSVDDTALTALTITGLLVLTALLLIWRPLMFASVDPDIAAARGVPVAVLGPLFMVLLGCAVALSIQIVGALLVLTLLCTPAAAARKVTASPLLTPLLSVLFATSSVVGGILFALGTSLPISPYVTTISFSIYLACRIAGHSRSRRGWDIRSGTSARARPRSATHATWTS